MKAYSLDFRQKIVEVYERDKLSIRKLAKRFNVATSFIQKLLKQHQETGDIAPKVRQEQTPMKLTIEQLGVLEQLVQEKNDLTLDELRLQLKERTGVLIGRATVDRMLAKLDLTLKKKTLYASEKESERVQKKRVEFWEMIQGFLAKDLIFIDEAGVNLALLRLMGRAPKGKRARGKQPQKRGQNISLIAALGQKGIVAEEKIMGPTDAITFEAFIAQRLVPKLWKGACIILDNCRIHRKEEIEPLIQEAGATLVFLPPYSPEFSPIENCWSKVKSILRSIAARNYPDLVQAIDEAFAKVSLDDIKGWFTHCCHGTSPD